MKTLVLGLGNELYGDDGVGIEVIHELHNDPVIKKLSQHHSLELKASNLTGLKLLDLIADFDVLLIIDTIKSDQPTTGKIRLLDGSELRHIPGPSPHYVSIPQMIELGHQIGLKMPWIVKIIAVEAKNIYQLGEGLTPEMKTSIPHIVRSVTQILEEVLS
ncbi:MAG: hypothetical protein B5M54_01890 [Candidatus Aminicenantes bacterium 4484_214]|nr:MAG: hypothetical protein B5M54_01890 [Candidatus Aminicenantes bacterium 4484_214]HDJ24166.1 hydrogenase maturation protease [Candidatus Aminicenantes bacterium]